MEYDAARGDLARWEEGLRIHDPLQFERDRRTMEGLDRAAAAGAALLRRDGTGDPAALVAAGATDPNGRVLVEATGRVFEIFVAVPDGRGGLHVAKGGVFSYYEFPWPMQDRLTDESWRAKVKAGQTPPQPDWTQSFVAK